MVRDARILLTIALIIPSLATAGLFSSVNTPLGISNDISLEQRSTRGALPDTYSRQSFIENAGQLYNDNIRFYVSSSGCSVGFGVSEVAFAKSAPNGKNIEYSMEFVESCRVEPIGVERLGENINYYFGNLSLTGISSYREIWFYNIYRNIDLHYYFSKGQLKYEFHLGAGANPSDIQIRISDSLQVEVSADSVSGFSSLYNCSKCLQENGLLVFDEDGNHIGAEFSIIQKNVYGFCLHKYDSAKSITIDPWIVSFGSLLGGPNSEDGRDIAIDGLGNLYITGSAYSGFPLKNPYQFSAQGSTDVIISEIDTSIGLIYSTYLGGGSSESGNGIVVDSTGNAYVTGDTLSPDFPTLNAFNSTYSGSTDGFLFKIGPTGHLIYSTYFGGNDTDHSYAVDVDDKSCAYICGVTFSSNLPTINAFDSDYTPGVWPGDAFVAEFEPSGDSLNFSTYIGGRWEDDAYDIAVDASGCSYAVGRANSISFPTTPDAFDPSYSSNGEAFVLKLNKTGNGLIYSSYLGGIGHDYAAAVDIDSQGNCYVAGVTDSDDFPVKNAAFGTRFGSGQGPDVFITKFNSTGSAIDYSTFLGGTSWDWSSAIAVRKDESCFVAGYRESYDFFTTNATFATKPSSGSFSGFAALLNSSGSGFTFSSYLGVSAINGLALSSTEECYLVGRGSYTCFPAREQIPEASDDGNVAILRLGYTDDITAPTVSEPEDLVIHQGITGVQLNWTASDLNPISYTISRNGTVVKEGSWTRNGEILSIALSGLDTYTYNCTITVTDVGWNSAGDSVLVTVIEATTSTTTSTSTSTNTATSTLTSTSTNTATSTSTTTIPGESNGPGFQSLDQTQIVIVGIGALVLVVVILLIVRKRR